MNSMLKSMTVVALFFLMAVNAHAAEPALGRWRAWLDCPGETIPFEIELSKNETSWQASVINGLERIDVPIVTFTNNELVLDFTHYDSRIRATLDESGRSLSGTWERRRGPEQWTRMKFHGVAGDAPRFEPIQPSDPEKVFASIDGRWSVNFHNSIDPAVGFFRSDPKGTLTGTFLTTTGDYRFLAGVFQHGELRLSCFDGAHAFLFTATFSADRRLQGKFYSRDSWQERWTGTRNPTASLPNGFRQTTWTGKDKFNALAFPDLSGSLRRMDDPKFAGKARIIEVFGSWCPNCHDAAKYMTELHKRYGDKGLSILGLAFELTGEHKRDAAQVKKFMARHGVKYPILIAGISNKEKASEAFPVLDRIRSYPTTIFLHADGRVRAIYSGFSGPATGEEHAKLRKEFESIIEELLAEETP